MEKQQRKSKRLQGTPTTASKRQKIGEALRERGRNPSSDIRDVWANKKTTRNHKKKRALGSTIKGQTKIIRSRLKPMPVRIANKVTSFNKRRVVGALILVVGVGGLFNYVVNNTSKTDTQQLGASIENAVTTQDIEDSPNIVTSSEVDFKMLFPNNKSIQDLEIAKVSPPGNEPVYAYLDNLESAQLRISQQQVPEDFDSDRPQKLKEVAENFQATSIIELDGNIIYHGSSDDFGGVQSLVFLKDDILVFISSSKNLPDPVWVGYIAGLK